MSDNSTVDRRRAARFTPEQQHRLRRLLDSEKLRLLRRYQAYVAREKGIVFDEAEDFADRADKSQDREKLFALTEAEREQLVLVEEALARIADGSYGFCFIDDEPIPVARLRAVPWARYCTRHQAAIEAELLHEADLARLWERADV